MISTKKPHFLAFVMLCFGLLLSPLANATVPANVQAKVDQYKKKLQEWAAHPAVIDAVRSANQRGTDGMTNGKWEELADDAPAVQATIKAPVSKNLGQWEQDKGINKLFVRDQKGNVVAGTSRTLLFNAGNRPHIKAALNGEIAQTKEIKPDPTTQVPSIQVAVPILDAGKAIGVMHTAVNAE